MCTFIGIDETKRAEHPEAYFKSIVQTVREPLLVLVAGLRVVSANARFYSAFGLEPANVEGTHISGLASGNWDTAELRRLLEDVLPRDRSLVDYDITAEFDHLGRKRLLLNARQLERDPGEAELILLVMEVIDESGSG